ncbi:DUF502 domain-containing protein [Parahaliea maris]|uniref:DUF502 domain-containing protein n=1 Tax=Parahaliea maris TaxID=2716870 RepID=A0A5C9A999_9GAMM|nr:DUF502 domain-containing protein [Parahaliea maris]TXS96220.1 DUF502 domain-containing protein [Parahaliea maris]
MKRIFTLALQGLAAVLPVALTIYLVYWLLLKMERLASAAFLYVMPREYYFQGLGVISAFFVLVGIGILVKVYVVRYLIRMGEALLGRIPLVKSVIGAIKDFMRVFSLADSTGAESVVLVEVQEGMHLIGFVTGRNIAQRMMPEDKASLVGVYLPMSYQIGGYTLYVPAEKLTPLEIGVEEAMRIALTGGIQNQKK